MSQLSSPFKSHDETGKRENGKTGKRENGSDVSQYL